jgi:cyclopropane-fatty-acyl-phospholipid synthase
LTISTEQLAYANERIKKAGLEDKINLVLLDYRDMVVEKYGQFDKISNFEMSEHVGVRNYQTYMA